ncbi:MAG TPA: hypothetical protein VHZ26_12140 [Caulobacteraceae bacterium]|nr:hypothetical protein [Caulobacteraceae bacterium]
MSSAEIYEALFDDEALALLPNRLTASVDGRSSILQWVYRDGGWEALSYCYFTPEYMQIYGDTWAAQDPWTIASRRPSNLNKVFLLEQSVPVAAFARSTIYNEFIRPIGDDTFHCLGVAFSTDWGDGIISVNRGRTAAAFGAAELAQLRRHANDVGRVLKVRGEIASARRDARAPQDAIDAIALPIMIVNAEGRLLAANAVADVVLNRMDGLAVRRGALAAIRHGDGAALQQAIVLATASANPRATSVVVSRGPEAPPYLVTVTPVARLSGAGRAMLIFRDPDVNDLTLTDRLRTLFGLSPSEAAIAIDLSLGRSTADILAKRGVRPSTLKTQLESLTGKMGCARQSEVAARVASLPPITSS